MTKRIALISDIHGNQTALEAVIDDLHKHPVDETWFLGDLLGPGPATDVLFDLLEQVNTTIFLNGNWDTDCFLPVLNAPETIDTTSPKWVYLGRIGQYIGEHITPEHLAIMQNAPIHAEIAQGPLNLSLNHNLPDVARGRDLEVAADTNAFAPLFTNESVDIAVYAHVHHPLLRYSTDDRLIINPGAVGEPYFNHPRLNADRRAQYAILTLDDQGMADVEFRKVTYDIPTELARARVANLPYYELYQELLESGISHTNESDYLMQFDTDGHYTAELETFLNQQRQ
ncbi:serine/threonine protein phosphatase [Weissella viridescens]|uniref:Metallophosphoesterase n=1 Tax=Weissella viridescens TaxID=1629 RepID=A0A0R2H5L2_WEIVI|nr:metallophosphoesterase family protein [Weissella viridescens]KRN46902.1 metallophosphoesterase [Weissella viridescens]GEA94245.1 serine/threonine protein phosphatase [Weissella viridescens]